MARAMTRGIARPSTARGFVHWGLVLGLLVLALPITFHDLGVQSLWLDEGTTQAYVTSQRIGSLLLDLLNPTQAYPLYHIVVKLVTRTLGDSEWALRFPSALAGALAVPALYLLGTELRGRAVGLIAAVLLLLAPWGLRQAQDAKAYSLALLTSILLALLLARALRLHAEGAAGGAWLQFAALVVMAPFVHRLLLLSLLGCAAAWSVFQPRARRWPMLLAIALGAVLLLGAIVGGLQYQRASSQFAGASPPRALALTFAQFAVGQFAGAVPFWWLIPFGLLAALGIGRCLWELRSSPRNPLASSARKRGPVILLTLGGMPLILFLALLAVQPLYESRYLVGVYPFWLLLLAWGAAPPDAGLPKRTLSLLSNGVGMGLVVAALLVEQRALVQPGRGIFSGATIKEDYRNAVGRLARHVHPDDLVLIHPGSIRPLYDYYARRVSMQPLPEPVDFTPLFQAKPSLIEIDRRMRPLLRSTKRAWLLIAPDHARVIDPPPTADDDVGWIGLAFQYGDREGRIQCGEQPYAGFTGVRLYCNNLPDIAGKVPEPATSFGATFNQQLRLRGYTVTPFPGGPRSGGTLPVSLFWEPLADLSATNYIVFLHLTRPDDPRPLAQTDGVPMEGGQPTSRWTEPHALLHDDRALPLPAELAPGMYVLRIGVYRASDGTRLPVVAPGATVLDDAVVLGQIQIVQ